MSEAGSQPARMDAGGVAAPKGSGDSHSGIAGIDPLIASEKWSQEARRHQRTPGAYEWWNFEAIDTAGNGVAVFLFEGLPFHPLYMASVFRHTHRGRSSPFDAIPRDAQSRSYIAAFVAVFEQGRRVAQGLNMYAPEADDDHPDDLTEIRLGPNRITLRQDGSLGLVARVYPYRVARFQPRLLRTQTITVTLNLSPTMPGVQHVRPFRGPGPDGATHVWALSVPHAKVTGNVAQLDTAEGVSVRDMHINAIGYHDHVYGQGGMALGLRRMHWGYLQGDDWTAIWHHSPMKGKGRDHADGFALFQRGLPPIVIDGPSVHMDQRRLSKWFLGYPGRISMHGSDTQGNPAEMVLRNGPAATNAPFYTRLESRGSITIPGRRQLTGRGVTHVMKLGRLRWPVLSDLVLMAIHDVRADDPLWRQ